jgi:hypothetical protein
MLNGDDLPPLLHGHFPVSSLLRGSPPLSGASVLSASRLEPLAPFPLASPARFSRSIQEPGRDSRHLHAGYRLSRLRHPPSLSRRTGQPSVLTSSKQISTLLQRFAYARLSRPCLTGSCPDFSATFTTMAFDHSSLRWLPGRRGCFHPRPPQTRTCAIDAFGSSRERFVLSGIAVDDPGRWQWIAGAERVEACPCEQLPSRSTFHPLVPDPLDLVAIFL